MYQAAGVCGAWKQPAACADRFTLPLRYIVSMCCVVCGQFMAPEVMAAADGGGYGRKADVWSFGVTVLQMATAELPWPNQMNAVYKASPRAHHAERAYAHRLARGCVGAA